MGKVITLKYCDLCRKPMSEKKLKPSYRMALCPKCAQMVPYLGRPP